MLPNHKYAIGTFLKELYNFTHLLVLEMFSFQDDTMDTADYGVYL